MAVIDGWLLADRDAPRKQRHTGPRVWQRLVAEHGAVLAEITVSRYVTRRRRELALHHHSTPRKRTRRSRRRPALSRVVGRYGRLDLLCLELGYVQINPRRGTPLPDHHRAGGTGIAIATNLPFSEWGTVFPDPRLVAAIVDRVTFNAHILETGTQSYRLRTSKATTHRKRT